MTQAIAPSLFKTASRTLYATPKTTTIVPLFKSYAAAQLRKVIRQGFHKKRSGCNSNSNFLATIIVTLETSEAQ